MNNQRRTGAGAAEDATHPSFAQPVIAVNDADRGLSTLVRLVFRERPYYDEMLLKTHPSKVYFDAFHVYETLTGPAAVLVSSVLVDKSIRH
jgi:hypothetical protein